MPWKPNPQLFVLFLHQGDIASKVAQLICEKMAGQSVASGTLKVKIEPVKFQYEDTGVCDLDKLREAARESHAAVAILSEDDKPASAVPWNLYYQAHVFCEIHHKDRMLLLAHNSDKVARVAEDTLMPKLDLFNCGNGTTPDLYSEHVEPFLEKVIPTVFSNHGPQKARPYSNEDKVRDVFFDTGMKIFDEKEVKRRLDGLLRSGINFENPGAHHEFAESSLPAMAEILRLNLCFYEWKMAEDYLSGIDACCNEIDTILRLNEHESNNALESFAASSIQLSRYLSKLLDVLGSQITRKREKNKEKGWDRIQSFLIYRLASVKDVWKKEHSLDIIREVPGDLKERIPQFRQAAEGMMVFLCTFRFDKPLYADGRKKLYDGMKTLRLTTDAPEQPREWDVLRVLRDNAGDLCFWLQFVRKSYFTDCQTIFRETFQNSLKDSQGLNCFSEAFRIFQSKLSYNKPNTLYPRVWPSYGDEGSNE